MPLNYFISLNISQLNHQRHQTALLSPETKFNPNPSYIYIGVYHRLCSYDEQHCRSYRECLKNVTINNNSINLINDEINQHHLLTSSAHPTDSLTLF
jgi:hypothetical protein